jgi:hypothetical protein
MRRLAVIARLKPGTRRQAEELIAQGVPFDLAASDFDRHTVYLSDGEVVFVFEGTEVEWQLDDLMSDVFHPVLQAALAAWRPLVEGEPHVAREAYFWQRDEARG